MKTFVITLLLIAGSIFGLWQLNNSRTYQLGGELISRVQVSDSLVVLTFDDGPTPEYTDQILAILDKYEVPATFFVTGRETEQNPEEARKIVTAGHQLANHSYSHQQMILKGVDFLEEEIERTDRVIREAGFDGEIYFRPPYCKKLILLPWLLRQKNRVSVTWDVEPESYREVRDDPKKIAEHVEQRVKPGSIILLHLMYESREPSRKALPIIITNLRKKGYRFVTVSELIEQGDGPA